MEARLPLVVGIAALALTACPGKATSTGSDAGATDAGSAVDAGSDAGSSATDAGLDAGAADAGPAPLHVTAFAHFFDSYSPSPSPLTAQQGAQWIDWAETNQPVAVHDAGIRDYLYTDPNQLSVLADGGVTPHDECDLAHTCAGCALASCDPSTCASATSCPSTCAASRIHLSGYAAYAVSDAHSPHLLSVWRTQVQARNFDAGNYDAVFEDDFANLYGAPTPCGSDPQDWVDAGTAMVGALGYPVIINGAGEVPYPSACYDDGGCLSPNLEVFDAPNAIGSRVEECYGQSHVACEDAGFYTVSVCLSSGSSPMPTLNVWQRMENTEIWMARHQKVLICMEDNRAFPECAIRERLYFQASFLLTYAPPWTVAAPLWGWQAPFPYLEVFPEELLVPTQPLIPTPDQIDAPGAILQDGGTYAREYASCFYAGQPIGPCAAIVNSACVDLPFPTLRNTYRHTVWLSGSGSYFDSATANLDGGAPPALVPFMSGLLMVP